jgi:hypothetical protein
MARRLVFTELAVNAQADATGRLLDGGKLLLCDGKMDTSMGRLTDDSPCVVASCRMSDPAFRAAVNGVIESYSLEEGEVLRDGKPTWACVTTVNGHGAWMMTAGTKNANVLLEMDPAGYRAGDKVAVSKIKLTMPRTREELK